MLKPYFGEFLVSPFPLELSLNYCSHKCAYCFANLNTPDRKANPVSIFNLLNEFGERQTLEAELLKRKFPVLISNKVDPFAASNHKLALPIIKTLRGLEIPMAFQTKGGRGIDDALAIVQPSHWYVSITTLDETVAKRVEPGAPPIRDRLALCEKLLSAGHRVAVGVNPMVREWLPNPADLLAQVRRIGVRSVWIETLHLNNNQTRNMSERERAAVGEGIISRSFKRQADAETYNYFIGAIEDARQLGLNTYCINNPWRSDYWRDAEELYPTRFPTFQGFLNWCHENKQPGGDVWFEEFWNYLHPQLPDLRRNISDYIGATSPYIKNTHVIPKDAGFKTLLSVMWSDHRAKAFPPKCWAFDECTETDASGTKTFVEDENGVPVHTFTGNILKRKEVKTP